MPDQILQNRTLGRLLTLAGALAFVLWFYSAPLLNPGSYVFSGAGDALKNYYTYTYHIEHDSSAIHFEGMNYPYGEHFLYTDGHPLLSLVVKYVPGLSGHSVAIVNLLILLSFILTAWFLYLILVRLKIPPLLAAVGALSVMVLAPQIFRMTGHLSLSYSFALPMSWYLVLWYRDNATRSRLFILFLNALFWFFTHAYLGIMIAAFILLEWLFSHTDSFLKRQFKLKDLQLPIGAALIPIVLFVAFSSLTDTHEGRTDNPSGFFSYNGEPDDIFIPHHPPIRPLFDSFVKVKQEWEGWAYVGIASGLLFLTVIVLLVRSAITRKQLLPFEQDSRLKPALLAAGLLLIFSFGIPFKPFRELADWLPFVKQFRATGRFAWPFFFVLTTACLWLVYFALQNWKNKLGPTLSIGLFLLLPLSYFWEGWAYHKDTADAISRTPNLFDKEQLSQDVLSALDAVDADQFQAILPLPFYYKGSESYSRPVDALTFSRTTQLSYHTGLPTFGAYLTRTGIPESKNIIQLLSPGWIEKPIRQDLPSEKPILILASNHTELTDAEKNVLNKGTEFFNCNNFRLLSISVDDLFRNNAAEVYEQFASQRDVLKPRMNCLTDTPAEDYFLYKNYDDQSSEQVFRGTGAYEFTKAGYVHLIEIYGGNFESGKTYNASAWMFNSQKDALNLYYRWMTYEIDPNGQKVQEIETYPESAETIDGDWSLVRHKFTVKDSKNTIKMEFIGSKDFKKTVYLDDLLILPEGNSAFFEATHNDQKELFYNNFRIPSPK